jgi:DNA-binding IclR family transcriptional regulator
VCVAFAAEPTVEEGRLRSPEGGTAANERLRAILEAVRTRGFSVGLETGDRRRMRRALRDLQEEPGSERARSELEDTVTGLTRLDTVLASIEPRRSYRVAHLAAPVFDQHGSVAAALYLLGFSAPVSGAEVERVGHQLLRVGVSVTRGGNGTIPRNAAFRS